MKIVKAGFRILDEIDGGLLLRSIERNGRVCYKSEDSINDDSAIKFVKQIIKSGHESVIEHEKISVLITCDRGVSHEIVRHRIASYSQESTRYCNYSDSKFGNELTFIQPSFWTEDSPQYTVWISTMEYIENHYMELVKLGAKPEEARSILPNSLKTEIVVTMNLREWRHFFRLRTHMSAHPQIREIAIPLCCKLKGLIPVVFDDIEISSI